MEYQDEVTVEQIMKMGLEEAYENLCIIEDEKDEDERWIGVKG